MLQPLVRVRNAALQRHLEKRFGFGNFPNAQSCVRVHLLLKKKRHGFKFQDYFALCKNSTLMILSDTRILEEIEKGTIKVEPYSREHLGSNSYDVHLGKMLATYKDDVLDAKKHNQID